MCVLNGYVCNSTYGEHILACVTECGKKLCGNCVCMWLVLRECVVYACVHYMWRVYVCGICEHVCDSEGCRSV